MSDTENPYPEVKYDGVDSTLFTSALEKFSKTSDEERNKNTDHHVNARIRYYRSVFNHFDGVDFNWAHLAPFESVYQTARGIFSASIPANIGPDDAAIASILKSDNKVPARKVKVPARKVEVVAGSADTSNLTVTIKSSRHHHYRQQPIKSEYMLATWTALHTNNDEERAHLIQRDSLQVTLKQRTIMFQAFSRQSSRKRSHQRANHETIHDAVRHRTDFENLCSNHTIKQYEECSCDMHNRLKGQVPRQFPKSCFIQKSTITLNSALEYDDGYNFNNMGDQTHGKGKFGAINVEKLKTSLNQLMNNQRAFQRSAEDQRKLDARLQEERKMRLLNERTSLSSMFG